MEVERTKLSLRAGVGRCMDVVIRYQHSPQATPDAGSGGWRRLLAEALKVLSISLLLVQVHTSPPR